MTAAGESGSNRGDATESDATDVVIVGAGPTGLMLACELRLAGIRVVVLERSAGLSEEPKANGLLGQVVRMVDQRGLYERLAGADGPPAPNASYFMFAALPLDLSLLDDSPIHALAVTQPRIVAVLAERAAELGVEIRHGHALVGAEQDDDGVRVEATAPGGASHRLRARYLVGADGAHSATRKLAGIAFPGVTYDRTTVRTAHATLPADRIDPASGALIVPGHGPVLPFLPIRTEHGGFSYAPLPGGPPLISTTEWDQPEREEAMSLTELEESVRRVLGAELPLAPPDGDGPHVLRRLSGGNTRIAERFRDGRVFLVGDAAHIYGATGGGPGLNLGLADALNLGWKLAAAIRGDAGPALLDSYESERRPAAERMSVSAQAQAALIAPGGDVTALRQLFGELLGDPPAVRRLADAIAGTDVRYEMGAERPAPLVGRLAPDFAVETADGTARLAKLTRTARPLLIDLTESGTLRESVAAWREEVDVVTGRAAAGEPIATGLLLRPDCYVAWASTAPDPRPAEREELRAAARRWLVPARGRAA